MKALTVDIVIPVRDEARCLAQSVRTLHAALRRVRDFTARIVIADNGSTDDTAQVAAQLTRELPHVMLLRVDAAGRGRALRAAWNASVADVVMYMDVDLSTDLGALPLAVEAVASGRADIAVGSRLSAGSRVQRSVRREVVSRVYNVIVRAALGVHFRDVQCGFKALRRDVAQRLLERVENQNWFFDTELLVLAARADLRVAEIPVMWVEDPNSSVAIVRTALEDLRGIMRLRRWSRERPRSSSLGAEIVCSASLELGLQLDHA